MVGFLRRTQVCKQGIHSPRECFAAEGVMCDMVARDGPYVGQRLVERRLLGTLGEQFSRLWNAEFQSEITTFISVR